MKHGSLFSGIGGFDLAAEWMGWENIFHCEIEDFPKQVLQYYWPSAISYDDIRKTDFTIHRGQIDILTGGFPCQPFSAAGKRKGTEDERHLWPEMLRAIREIQPRWIVGENVRGLVNWSGGLVFEQVQADLEAQGYKVQPFILPACAKDAPHRRDRVWFVAYGEGKGSRGKCEQRQREGESGGCNSKSIQGPAADTCLPGCNGNKELKEGCECKRNRLSLYESDTFHGSRSTADASITGLEGSKKQRGIKRSRENGNKQPLRCIQSAWQNFPTQSPVLSGNNGFSSKLDGITFPKWRNEGIKGAGNAVVPQVVMEIFKAIEAYENPTK